VDRKREKITRVIVLMQLLPLAGIFRALVGANKYFQVIIS